jgi:hypothetical protein
VLPFCLRHAGAEPAEKSQTYRSEGLYGT